MTEVRLLKLQTMLVENEVTFDILLEMDEQDLKELGINKGPRVKIVATMLTFCDGSAPSASASTRAPSRVRTKKALECTVCFDPFADTPKKTARVLTCGHTFCNECLAKCLAPLQAAHGHKMLLCPACRESTKVPRGNAELLTKNFGMM